MKKAQEWASNQNSRQGFYQVKSRYGTILDEVPLDFPDPATLKTDDYWLHYLATLWMTSGHRFPPTIEEVMWRDRKLDEEVSAYRMMLEFYLKYHKRPGSLRDKDGVDWDELSNGGSDEEH